jgi:hypothetical protein
VDKVLNPECEYVYRDGRCAISHFFSNAKDVKASKSGGQIYCTFVLHVHCAHENVHIEEEERKGKGNNWE